MPWPWPCPPATMLLVIIWLWPTVFESTLLLPRIELLPWAKLPPQTMLFFVACIWFWW